MAQDLAQDSEAQIQGFTGQDRIWYLTIAGLSVVLLCVARVLRPSAKGFGTHQQLGLPPCAFLHYTGIPCPSCGLTTSVAHAARLHFYESLITQPFGLIVFLSAVLWIPFAIYCNYRHISWSYFSRIRGRKFLIYTIIALFIISWLYKIATIKGLIAPG